MNISKLLNNKLFKVIIGLILTIFLALIIFMVIRINNKEYKYEIQDEKVYTYIGERKYEYNSKITVDATGSVSKIKSKRASLEISSYPIYYTTKKQVVFASKMALINPLNDISQNSTQKIFTINRTINNVYMNSNGKEIDVGEYFLFNGNDMYFFLDSVDISFNNYKETLPPFSYVIHDMANELYIYNYDRDEINKFKEITSDVIISTSNYSINLADDSVKCGDNEALLIKNIEFLDSLE